jgi:hypothetical protein
VRILLFWSYYDAYLERFYAARPGLAREPYARQVDAIVGDGFGWMPTVIRRLGEMGHEVSILVTNARPAQEAWAREQGLPFDDRAWRFETPREQVRRFAPDVLLIGSMFPYYGEYLRSLASHARKTVAWIGVPTVPGTDLRGIDLIVSSHENFLREFRARGLRAERLLPAFEPRVLESLPANQPRDIPASFVGSLTWAHRSRIALLRQVADSVPIQLHVSFPRVTWKSLARPMFLPAYLASRPLLAQSRGPVFGQEMYAILARSRLSVNVHIEGAQGLAGNMRMFEATGVGSLLLTESASNLAELFEPETEVVPYDSGDDLVRRMRFLLENEPERARIAAAGQQRTLRDHSSLRRAERLLGYLQDL